MSAQNLSAFVWSVADLLRGDFKQSDYGRVMLPFTILRRLDCVLELTEEAAIAENATRIEQGLDPTQFLTRVTGYSFYNTSRLSLSNLLADPNHMKPSLAAYLGGFSPNVSYFEREVLPHVPDAWIDEDKTRLGYEIPFTRHVYCFAPPRSLQEIGKDLRVVTGEILELLREVSHGV